MKILRLVFILSIISMISVPVLAQDEEGSWRNFEVYINGGMGIPFGDINNWLDSLGADPGFQIGVGGGYCFTERFSTGLYFNYSQLEMDGPFDRNFRLFDFGAYAKYALTGESSFEPYGKISAGMVISKYPTWVLYGVLREQSYDPDLTVSAGLGLLFYTSEYSGVFIETSYHVDLVEGVKAEYQGNKFSIDHNVSYMQVTIGINAFFGPDE
ncbi:MAG: outer membrane beta-barrel protein [Candidatus Zixiibacteriota bacterium]